MARLTDYPGFKKGDVYMVAMAGGEGEEASCPIREHVQKDKINAWHNESSEEAQRYILATLPEHWVDHLLVLREGEEIASWTHRLGWAEKKMKDNILDPNEAPPGYHAVLKSNVVSPETIGENICRHCDWRPGCNGWEYRCMSYELTNGLKREDGCSVVFKKNVPDEQGFVLRQ